MKYTLATFFIVPQKLVAEKNGIQWQIVIV